MYRYEHSDCDGEAFASSVPCIPWHPPLEDKIIDTLYIDTLYNGFAPQNKDASRLIF